MKILIIGGGEIGKAIASAMVEENNEVTIIESNETVASELNSSIDVQVIHGSGCNPSVLKKAEVSKAQIIAIVTDRDEDNLCASILCRYYVPEAKIIARIRNPDLAAEKDFLIKSGPKLTQILNPEILAARQIFYSIQIPSAVEVVEIESGKLFLVGVKIPSSSRLSGKTMKQLPEILPEKRIVFVARYRENSLIIPVGETDIQPNDTLYFVSKAEDMRHIAESLGFEGKEVRSAVISGATIAGLHLAKMMTARKMSIKIIEKNHTLASFATNMLPEIVILEAEPTDLSVWEEENLADHDALISVSKDEDLNLMVAILAKKMGIKHTAVMTFRSSFIPLLLESGITTVVNPRTAAISSVLRFLRKGRILQITETELEDAELIEYGTHKGDLISGNKIKDINFPRGSIVGAISREDEIIIPTGDTQIEGGDKILVFARKKAIHDLEKLMTNRR